MTDIGSSLVQGDGAPVVPGDGGNVVIEGHECELPEIKKEHGHVNLSEYYTSLFQVTVC